MTKTEIVTARVEPWVKEIIKNKSLTIRDALEYMAKMLANDNDLTWEHIKKIRGDIRKLELEFETLMLRTDEIQKQIQLKENKIEELEGKLTVNPDEMVLEKIQPSIDAIFEAAERLDCTPLELNRYASTDIYNHQALNAGVSKATLVQMVREVYEEKQKGGDV